MVIHSNSNFGFIFDLDGTLVDSGEQIFRAVRATRTRFDLMQVDLDFVVQRIGLPASILFEDITPSDEELEIYVEFFRKRLKAEILEKNMCIPGGLDFINLMKANGFKIGVATSKPDSLAKLVIQNSDYASSIDFIAGILNFPPKPDPSVILNCMAGLKIQKAIMLGDRIEDVQAAINAGIMAIGLAQTIHTSTDLMNSGATLVFENFSELLSNAEEVIRLAKDKHA